MINAYTPLANAQVIDLFLNFYTAKAFSSLTKE